MHRYTPLALLGLVASSANAFFLMPCWPVSTQRIDPIVDPGAVSGHVHQIAGGNAFAPAMNYSDTQAADCTTCFVKGDHSNYWIPALYVKYQNGSFGRVPQVGSASMYYFNEASRLGPGETMEAFPQGLRMLAGDPTLRASGTDFASQAINYKCLDYAGTPTDSNGFPSGNCPDGIRAQVTFPSCWDGENLDSADHKSHMAYPTETYQSGACPSTHPHHVVTLLVEFIFDTSAYQSEWSGGSQPFVWSTGDPTGYGLHADYVMGWKPDLLTQAVEQCFDPYGVLANCAPFAGQIQSAYVNPDTCSVDSFVDEDISGALEALPGCNPLQYGPANAIEQSSCGDTAGLIGKWADASTNGMLDWLNLPSSSQASSPAASSASLAAASSWVPISTANAFKSKAASTTGWMSAPAPAPSSTDDVTVTVTITHTDYLSGYGSATPAAASTSSGSWGKWRREIGDDIHKHHLRHLRYRHRAAQ